MRRVLLCIPCYNAEPYLDETLDSVAAQDAEDWRCIVVDDGSTDRSAAIAAARAARDPRFVLLRHEQSRGAGAARNTAIRAATDCTFVLPLDADDRIAPSYVRRAREVLEQNANVRIVYGNAELFGEQSGPWELPAYSLPEMLRQNVIFCTAMFRRSSWEKAGGYEETMRLEDWDLWLGILEHDPGDVVKLPEVVFYYRKRAASVSTTLLAATEERLRTTDFVLARHWPLYTRTFGSIHRALFEQIDLRGTLAYRGGQMLMQQMRRGRGLLGSIKRRMFT